MEDQVITTPNLEDTRLKQLVLTYVVIGYDCDTGDPISIDVATTMPIYINTPLTWKRYDTPYKAIRVAQRYERLLAHDERFKQLLIKDE